MTTRLVVPENSREVFREDDWKGAPRPISPTSPRLVGFLQAIAAARSSGKPSDATGPPESSAINGFQNDVLYQRPRHAQRRPGCARPSRKHTIPPCWDDLLGGAKRPESRARTFSGDEFLSIVFSRALLLPLDCRRRKRRRPYERSGGQDRIHLTPCPAHRLARPRARPRAAPSCHAVVDHLGGNIQRDSLEMNTDGGPISPMAGRKCRDGGSLSNHVDVRRSVCQSASVISSNELWLEDATFVDQDIGRCRRGRKNSFHSATPSALPDRPQRRRLSLRHRLGQLPDGNPYALSWRPLITTALAASAMALASRKRFRRPETADHRTTAAQSSSCVVFRTACFIRATGRNRSHTTSVVGGSDHIATRGAVPFRDRRGLPAIAPWGGPVSSTPFCRGAQIDRFAHP